MTSKEIYQSVKVCIYLTIEKKIYNGSGWPKKDSDVVGFIASTNNIRWNKDLLLNKIKYYCEDRKLPIILENIEGHATRFKIKIIKPCTQE